MLIQLTITDPEHISGRITMAAAEHVARRPGDAAESSLCSFGLLKRAYLVGDGAALMLERIRSGAASVDAIVLFGLDAYRRYDRLPFAFPIELAEPSVMDEVAEDSVWIACASNRSVYSLAEYLPEELAVLRNDGRGGLEQGFREGRFGGNPDAGWMKVSCV